MYLNVLIGVFGLMFDITGAWFISRGLVKKTDKQIINESRTYYGANFNITKSNVYQKVECTIGFVFLAVGFMLQAIGYLDSSGTKVQTRHIILFTAIYVIVTVISVLVNIKIRDKYYKKFLKAYEESKSKQ